MDEDELSDWFDRQHVEVLRTHATTFTGIGIGAFLTRRRFLELLPGGPRFPRPASNKATPVPAATCLTPPPSSYPTLLPCHRMVETRTSAIASGVSSTTTAAPTRSAVVLTKRLAGELAQVGLSLEVGTELNFYLFEESPTVARQQKWRNLTPVTASPISHSIRNSRLSADFMMQARKRLDFRSIEWDG
jgi:hypothetical protein